MTGTGGFTMRPRLPWRLPVNQYEGPKPAGWPLKQALLGERRGEVNGQRPSSRYPCVLSRWGLRHALSA